MAFTLQDYEESANSIKELRKGHELPEIAIICGSGLGGLAESLEGDVLSVNYEKIPGFVGSTAHGHAGELVFGKLSGKNVVCMKGRFHCYEGYSVHVATFPIRVFKLLGVKIVIVTNAAGGLNPDFNVGDLMLISDHYAHAGMAGLNALIGPNIDDFGPRFPAISDAYTPRLRELFAECYLTNTHLKDEKNLVVHEGVYGMVTGPCYETRVECRALLKLGCDAVGMSTVPEVVVAKHCGLEVLAVSLITNRAVLTKEPSSLDIARAKLNNEPIERKVENFANHEEVMEVANARALDLQTLIKDFLGRI
ncbi:Purine nucleoside phosphorylase [Zancudomyces culisetae]|uniref:Purine nucleoside phosphorylase n=1 Tax=Zancudomyces culisetae TaxID=1213189 RepID=A0A1R1PDQ8_ZANCU|nr:Purine nucleoside phosphorylase [Zancudomyces culisetae]|eukprot:OMH79048.1 Purine nucleoside phosphorylase [Zancudomyces culisetae]